VLSGAVSAAAGDSECGSSDKSSVTGSAADGVLSVITADRGAMVALAREIRGLPAQVAEAKAALAEEQEHAENMPRFFLQLYGASGFCGKLKIAIMNVSNNIAYDINLYNVKLERGENTIWEYKDTYGSPVINPQKHIEIQTQTPSQNQRDDIIFSATMSCLDKYNDKHEYVLKMICRYPNNYEETSVTEI